MSSLNATSFAYNSELFPVTGPSYFLYVISAVGGAIVMGICTILYFVLFYNPRLEKAELERLQQSYRNLPDKEEKKSVRKTAKHTTSRDPPLKSRGVPLAERHCDRTEPIFKIVFTGGPRSGKSTALKRAREMLDKLKFKTFEVAEADTIFSKGGALEGRLAEDQYPHEEQRIKLQIALEDAFADMAANMHPNDKVVILCEKGVMDSAARLDPNTWQALLDDAGWNPIILRDSRYDLVIHMITAADGAEDLYVPDIEEGNKNIQEARALDRKIQEAWVGHPSVRVIGNTFKSFEDKIQACMDVILVHLHMNSSNMGSFYKKFQVSDSNWGSEGFPLGNVPSDYFKIDDLFLIPREGCLMEKVSRKGKKDSFVYTHTVRKKEKDRVVENKKQISARDYIQLLDRADKGLQELKKERQCFLYQKLYFIVDRYANVKSGPCILKAYKHFEADDLYLPGAIKIIRDVTGIEEFTSENMAKPGWSSRVDALKPSVSGPKPGKKESAEDEGNSKAGIPKGAEEMKNVK